MSGPAITVGKRVRPARRSTPRRAGRSSRSAVAMASLVELDNGRDPDPDRDQRDRDSCAYHPHEQHDRAAKHEDDGHRKQSEVGSGRESPLRSRPTGAASSASPPFSCDLTVRRGLAHQGEPR